MKTVTRTISSEVPKAITPWISSETGKLRTVAMWGKPSTEAVLAQLYPPEVSLFLDKLDVAKAGKEIDKFRDMLRDNGVRVVEIKAELARLLPEDKSTRSEILSMLLTKAKSIQETYGAKGLTNGKVGELLEVLLDQDIREYGPGKAFALTKALCLDPPLPLGNIIYARDTTNVAFGSRIVSSMQKDIRLHEVDLYEKVYRDIIDPNTNIIRIPNGEKFEGGDLYVHGNTVYVAVGPRTSLGAAVHIFKKLKEQKSTPPNVKFAIVHRDSSDQSSFEEQQQTMHLDTYSMPAGRKEIAVCESEAAKRTISFIKFKGNGPDYEISHTGKSFIEYLEGIGYKVLKVPKSEQFGCNFVMAEEDIAIVPLNYNEAINRQLKENGKGIIDAGLGEVRKMFGAAHCALAQLVRD